MVSARTTTTLALASTLAAAAACGAVPMPPPAATGDWHVAGSTGALISSTDAGDFGENDRIDGRITAGQFLSPKLLLEGTASISDSRAENGLGFDTDVTTAALGVGGRYYLDSTGTTRPYLGVDAGMASVAIDDQVTGIDDSDTAPFLGARVGLESFLSDSVSMDFGLGFQEIFSVDLENTEEDVTSFGAFAGLSLWL